MVSRTIAVLNSMSPPGSTADRSRSDRLAVSGRGARYSSDQPAGRKESKARTRREGVRAEDKRPRCGRSADRACQTIPPGLATTRMAARPSDACSDGRCTLDEVAFSIRVQSRTPRDCAVSSRHERPWVDQRAATVREIWTPYQSAKADPRQPAHARGIALRRRTKQAAVFAPNYKALSYLTRAVGHYPRRRALRDDEVRACANWAHLLHNPTFGKCRRPSLPLGREWDDARQVTTAESR